MSHEKQSESTRLRRRAYRWFARLGVLLLVFLGLLILGPREFLLMLFLVGLAYPLLMGFVVFVAIECYFSVRVKTDPILFLLVAVSIAVGIVFTLNLGFAEFWASVLTEESSDFGKAHPYYLALEKALEIPEWGLLAILGLYSLFLIGVSQVRLRSLRNENW